MPRVTFYVIQDGEARHLLPIACRLIEKAFLGRHKVYVQAASRAQAEALDEALWAFKPESFIPHHLVGEGPTPPPPVRIGWEQPPPDAGDILLNLHPQIPETFGRFQRILEIVTGTAEERAPQRLHWRHYREQGLTVDSHDLRAPDRA